MNKRIVGIDVARALAVIGMIIVNFKMVFGHSGSEILYQISSIFDGKAAATFVVLAGVGIAFATKNVLVPEHTAQLISRRNKILKRALLLFVIGISYIPIWPADILHFYGVYIPITILLISKKSNTILWTAIALVFLFPVLMLFMDYELFWDFTNYEYDQFWTLKGFMYNLFFNGFHPIIPWTAFMLIGLWWGRNTLHSIPFILKSMKISLGIFIGIQIISKAIIYLLADGQPEIAQELSEILGTSPMPPLPIYMISGASMAIFIISTCIYISQQFKSARIVQYLADTGKLALTFYVAHVILGMGIIEIIFPNSLGTYSIEFSIGYAFFFSMTCIVFARIWLKQHKTGPLEWIIQRIISL